MRKFQVALSHDFFKPDGSPAFPQFDLDACQKNGIAVADVAAVIDVMHRRVPRGIVNGAIVDSASWRHKLDRYRVRFGHG